MQPLRHSALSLPGAVVIDDALRPLAAQVRIDDPGHQRRVLDGDPALVVVAVERPRLDLPADERPVAHQGVERVLVVIALGPDPSQPRFQLLAGLRAPPRTRSRCPEGCPPRGRLRFGSPLVRHSPVRSLPAGAERYHTLRADFVREEPLRADTGRPKGASLPPSRDISRWPDCRSDWRSEIRHRMRRALPGPETSDYAALIRTTYGLPEHRGPSSHGSVKWPCPPSHAAGGHATAFRL